MKKSSIISTHTFSKGEEIALPIIDPMTEDACLELFGAEQEFDCPLVEIDEDVYVLEMDGCMEAGLFLLCNMLLEQPLLVASGRYCLPAIKAIDSDCLTAIYPDEGLSESEKLMVLTQPTRATVRGCRQNYQQTILAQKGLHLDDCVVPTLFVALKLVEAYHALELGGKPIALAFDGGFFDRRAVELAQKMGARIEVVLGDAIGEQDAKACIERVFDEYGYIGDLSLGGAFFQAQDLLGELPVLLISTDSPFMFVDQVLDALGESVGKTLAQSYRKLRDLTALPIPTEFEQLEKCKIIDARLDLVDNMRA